MEEIAAAAGVSKRTFYARFADKGTVFLAVVGVLVRTWLAGFDESIGQAGTLEEALLAASRRMLDVALTPTALALYGLVTAEATRFPELAGALRQGGAETGVARVSALLLAHMPHLTPAAAAFAAEQFQTMVVSGPQRRAMLGANMDAAARERWCRASMSLLLHGIGPSHHLPGQPPGQPPSQPPGQPPVAKPG